MEKVGFLFGAGAEASFGIASGEDFTKGLLLIEGDNNDKNGIFKKVIEDFYSIKNEENRIPYWSPEQFQSPDKNIEIDSLLKKSIKKSYLENGFPEKIEEELLKTQLDEIVKKEVNEYKGEKEKLKKIYKYPSYVGFLDENFHTIISPRYLGPEKFCRVVSYYTRAYLLICECILLPEEIKAIKKPKVSTKFLDDYKQKLKEILEKPLDTYNQIITETKENYSKQESYYKIINGLLKKNTNKFKYIITTNYTPVCKEITGIEDKKITYIHGKLNYFEDPYRLQVYDVQKKADSIKIKDKFVFPYLFIQSGIKPVIEEKQLNEYSKALKFLNKIDHLVVLGYNFNFDDNHLNSLIHSFLAREGKKITIFKWIKSEDEITEEDEKTNCMKKLRIDDDSLKDNIDVKLLLKGNEIAMFEEHMKKI